MNKPLHTPSPWTFVQGGSGDYPTWNVRIGPSLVYLPGVFDMPVMDANARLIAAAPELLACLSELVRDCLGYEYPDSDEALDLIKRSHEAIAKATGTP